MPHWNLIQVPFKVHSAPTLLFFYLNQMSSSQIVTRSYILHNITHTHKHTHHAPNMYRSVQFTNLVIWVCDWNVNRAWYLHNAMPSVCNILQIPIFTRFIAARRFFTLFTFIGVFVCISYHTGLNFYPAAFYDT